MPRSFDRLAFVVRVVVIAVLSTLVLAERVHIHDRTGAIVTAVIGYVILPAIAYLHTRYFNSVFMVGVTEAVRRKIGGRTVGGPR